jgi:purine-binding chemotaxis protein CheW
LYVRKNQFLYKFVVFQFLENKYALPVEMVIEVLRMVAVTPLPEAPARLYGMVNLRGSVILVMDLRAPLKSILPRKTVFDEQ